MVINLVLVYESGTIGAKPTVLPLSIGDGELATTADAVVSMPEIFAYWLQAGRVDVGFLGVRATDGYDLVPEETRLHGAGGFHVALEGESVELLPRKAVLFCDPLCGLALMYELVFIADSGVQVSEIAFYIGEHRDAGHGLDASREHVPGVARGYRLSCEVDRLLAGAAHPVERYRGDGGGQGGEEHGESSDIRALLAVLSDAARDHVVDLVSIDACPLQHLAYKASV